MAKLANSNGKNKGKKYLTQERKKHLPVNNEVVELFNEWFGKEYNNIIKDYKKRNYNNIKGEYLNEDVLHNTYIYIIDSVKYRPTDYIQNFKVFFDLSYYTNLIKYNMEQDKHHNNKQQVVYMDDNGNDSLNNNLNDLIDDNEESELKQLKYIQYDELLDEIKEYVITTYSMQEYELWNIYMNARPITYKTLSMITNISVTNLSKIISTIKKDLLTNENFQRKKEKIEKHIEID